MGQDVRVSEVSEATGTLTSALIVDGAVAADPVRRRAGHRPVPSWNALEPGSPAGWAIQVTA